WSRFVPEELGLSFVQDYFVDHMKAGPNYWWTFLASTEDPTEEKLPKIEQPLLVTVPHDDSYQQAQDALPLLPPQAVVVDQPHITHVIQVFTTYVDENVDHIRRFLA